MTSREWPFIGAGTRVEMNEAEMAGAVARAALAREYDEEGRAVGWTPAGRVLGQVVREVRQRRRLSRGRLADTAGLDPAFIVLLENGDATEAELTGRVKERLAVGLNLSLQALEEIVQSSLSLGEPVFQPVRLLRDVLGKLRGVGDLRVLFRNVTPHFPVFREGEDEGADLAGMVLRPAAALTLRALAPGGVMVEEEARHFPLIPIEALEVVLRVEPLTTGKGRGVAVVVTNPEDRRQRGWRVTLTSGGQSHGPLDTDSIGRAEFWDVERLDLEGTFITVEKPE